MSYILEALKKAQAERQLGHAPDIHTAPLHAAAPAQQRSARTRVWIGAGAGAVIALAAAAWWFRSAGPLTTAVPVAHSAAPQPAPAAARPALVPAAAPAAPASSGTAPSGAITPAVAAAAPAPAALPRAAAPPLAAAAPPAAPAAPAAAATPAAAPAGQDADDALPTARELPDAIRQSLPPISLGGYIYATNPADRLVLIDKTLRHEGEEIAPGLTLERLQPRYAVLNFRGSRYRVPY